MNFFDPRRNPGPMISAHRGNRCVCPENTLCSFEASLGCCDYIETDIQMSRDGVTVVCHDPELGRTCNLADKGIRIDSLSLSELRRLDFGSWFLEADPFDGIKNGLINPKDLASMMPQTIMTLAELLAWSIRVNMPLNIEIKDQQGCRFDTDIVDAVLAEISRADCKSMLIISSFNHGYLKDIANKMPDIALGALQENENPSDPVRYLRDLGACAYHPDEAITTPDMIAQLKAAGIAVNVFTVNDPKQQQALLAQGVTSLITDFPELAGTLIKKQ